MDDTNETTGLFQGLKALSIASFPKRCANCGAEYETVEDFVKKTDDVAGQSGLKKGYDDEEMPIVELFRNCICGSTLMDCFSDRRDTSEAGVKRRALFDQLMKILTRKGLKASSAREQLLLVLRGEHSEVLAKMGIDTQIR